MERVVRGIFLQLLANSDLTPDYEPHGLFSCVCAKSLQWGLTLCDPMDCSPPGSSVHGILQARVLEWSPFHGATDFLVFPESSSNNSPCC